MKRFRTLTWGGLAVAAVTAAVAAPAIAHSSPTVTIRHEMHGCHAWSFAGGPFKSSLKVSVARSTSLTVVDNDVMPHTFIQVAGTKVTIARPAMRKMGATAVVRFSKAGVYRFTTKAGEDYKYASGTKTIGEDNVLRLTVTVR
jgi:plastocyanin